MFMQNTWAEDASDETVSGIKSKTTSLVPYFELSRCYECYVSNLPIT